MGQVFHRSSGRAWRLRQQSLALWEHWCQDLEQRQRVIPRRQGLLLLAANPDEQTRQQQLVAARQRLGLPLEWWPGERLAPLQPQLPSGTLGALWSPRDGQLDGSRALDLLGEDALELGLEAVHQRAVGLRARSSGGWVLGLEDGTELEGEVVVLANGIAAPRLLANLDPGLAAAWAMEPVLGQALELELQPESDPGSTPATQPWQHWPGAVVWQGMNLIPRPDLPGGRRFWLGATVEPGCQGGPEALQALRLLGGAAPPWLQQARVCRQWQGLRPRPVGHPAPVLEVLAPGLLLASGHHRNGVLLAPASAAWVLEQLNHLEAP